MAERNGKDGADIGSITPAVWWVPAVVLVAAVAPMPYGFYTFLRILVCGAAAFLAWRQFVKEGRLGYWPVLLGALAVLFNPIIPIHLSRSVWAPIDIGAAAIFGVHYFASRSGRR